MLNSTGCSLPIEHDETFELLDVIRDGLIVLDGDWHCRFANRAFEVLLRRHRDDMLGRSLWDILDTTANALFATELQRATAEQRRGPIGWTTPDGRGVHVYVLARSDSIALLLRAKPAERSRTRLSSRCESSARGPRHAREAAGPTVLELNSVIAREEAALRPLLGAKVRLRVAPDVHAGMIHADPDKVGQVLVNLVVNARDAMPNGGTITVETDAMSVRPQDGPRWHGLAPGVYSTLVVSDTGIGMDEATKARIFEPFFTTKGTDRGAGLGLAIVSDVVRESGGTILVESTPGRGSAFIIYWPSAALAA